MRDLNLKATEHFEAVARLGTVTKAANELGVTPSAISQQIKLLETQLGVKLFRRQNQRLALTFEGDRLFQTTTQAFSALRNAKNAIIRQKEVRNLIIRASPSFGVRWLSPRISEFANQNPEWNLRVDATTEISAFEMEAVDLDIRYGLGNWAGLMVKDIINDLVLPFCSPDYLAKLQELSDDPKEQVKNARFIDSTKALFRWDFWLASNNIEVEDMTFPLRFDRSSMSIELAKQGCGLALDSINLCLDDIISGALVPVSTEFPVIEFPAYWFVAPERHLNRRIVNRFYTWLLERTGEHEAKAKAVLSELGCHIHKVDGTSLVDVKPWEL